MSWLVDGRWQGHHGIGRYAGEVLPRLRYDGARLTAAGAAPPLPLDALYLRTRLRRAGASHYYSPGFNPAARAGAVQLLTVHDLIHLDVPGESSPLRRLYYERLVRPAILAAGRVLTVSRFSAGRIAAWSGLPLDDVVVASGGCSPAFLDAPLPPRSGPDRGVVLFVGNARPHKRLDLLAGVARALPRTRFVCVGVRAEDLARLGLDPSADRFALHHGISDRRLADLYARASCLLFPSDYEGWGLPALEALAVGLPTVYSSPAIAEVVGDLGFRVPPGSDAEAYAVAVGRAAETWTDGHAAAARAHAARATWQETARTVQRQMDLMSADAA